MITTLGAGQPQNINFEPEYLAVLSQADAMGYTKPSGAQQAKQNNFLKSLKSLGIWAKMDIFYMFATDAENSFATLNWKSPGQNHLTKVSSPIFETNKGFRGNGVDAGFMTNFTPGGASQYSLNDASRITWIYDNTATNTATGCIDGLRTGGTGGTDNCFFAISSAAHRINQGVTNLPAAVDLSGVGFRAISRVSSTAVKLFSGKTEFNSNINSTALVAAPQTLITRAASPLYGVLGLSCYGMGANISPLMANFDTLLINYLNSL
jgi:hypothetical protein